MCNDDDVVLLPLFKGGPIIAIVSVPHLFGSPAKPSESGPARSANSKAGRRLDENHAHHVRHEVVPATRRQPPSAPETCWTLR